MKLELILQTAAAAVKAAGIPPELEAMAFSKAIDILVSSTQPTDSNGADGDAQPTRDHSVGRAVGAIGLRRIAESFDIPVDEIEEFFYEHEGALQISLSTEKLGSNTAARTRTIGLLLPTARQIGGFDSGATPLKVIRKECERHHVYDSANFSKHLADLGKQFIVNGTGAQRTYKTKPSAHAAAKKLVAELMAL